MWVTGKAKLVVSMLRSGRRGRCDAMRSRQPIGTISELMTRLDHDPPSELRRVMIDQYTGTTRGADRGAALGVLATLVRRKLALFGMAVILLTSLLAVAAPVIAPYPYEEQLADGISEDGAPLPPNLKYLLGTDLLGRDLMSRLIWGGRTSLVIGVGANGASVLIGSFIGIVAGFFGGPGSGRAQPICQGYWDYCTG